MSWTCVGSVFRSPVKIFNNPIEPSAKVIFGPSLNVMQKKFLGSLMASFYAYGTASTNNNFDVFKLFFVSEVSFSIKTRSTTIGLLRFFCQDCFYSFLHKKKEIMMISTNKNVEHVL